MVWGGRGSGLRRVGDRVRGDGALERRTLGPVMPQEGVGKGSRRSGSGPEWMGRPY
jgi:hypothetical protein